jgi:hypothetical protein
MVGAGVVSVGRGDGGVLMSCVAYFGVGGMACDLCCSWEIWVCGFLFVWWRWYRPFLITASNDLYTCMIDWEMSACQRWPRGLTNLRSGAMQGEVSSKV